RPGDLRPARPHCNLRCDGLDLHLLGDILHLGARLGLLPRLLFLLYITQHDRSRGHHAHPAQVPAHALYLHHYRPVASVDVHQPDSGQAGAHVRSGRDEDATSEHRSAWWNLSGGRWTWQRANRAATGIIVGCLPHLLLRSLPQQGNGSSRPSKLEEVKSIDADRPVLHIADSDQCESLPLGLSLQTPSHPPHALHRRRNEDGGHDGRRYSRAE
ncbi:hypothetical protein PENTCL1PPCAC_265, partial [Pristionchus entomophagus]